MSVTEGVDIVVKETGSKVVKRNLEEIGGAANVAGNAIDQLNRLLAAVGIGVTLAQTLRTLADFSQEMSTLRAVSGATGAEFQALRDETKRLGAQTRFSATEAAQAATELARAGFTSGQVLQSLGATLTLAQAGGVGLAQASEIAGTALRGFRLEADQAQRVVDVLAEASNRSNAGVVDLGEAMGYVAPIAAGVGVDIEEATAAIAALSDAGLKGSTAGTGLRRVISELESPSTKAVQILRDLGLSTDDVRVSQVGLTTALERLSAAGIDTGLALEFFGDRGGPAFEVLQSSIPKVKAFDEQLRNAGGSAQRVADIMDDNLNGALLSVSSGFEALVIAAGDLGAESALTKGFRALAAALRYVADNLEDVVQGVAVMSATSVVAFGGMARAVALVRSAVIALNVAVAANPIGAVAVAIAAATAAVLAFGDEIAVTSDGMVTLKDAMLGAFDAGVEGAMSLGSTIAEFVGGALDNLGFSWADVLEAIRQVWNAHLQFINGTIGLFVGLGNVVSLFASKMAEAVSGAVRSAVEYLKTVFETVRNFLVKMYETMTALISRALELVGLGAEEIADRVRTAAQIGSVIGEVGFDIAKFFIPPEVRQLGAEASAAFLEGFRTDFVGGATDAVGGALGAAGDALMARARARAEERRQLEAAAAGGGLPADSSPVGAATPLGEASGPTVAFRQSETAMKALREELFGAAAATKTLEDAQKTLAEAVGLGAASAEEAAMIGRVLAEQLNEQLNPMQAMNEELDRQARLLRMTTDERTVAAQVREYELALLEKGVIMSEAERKALEQKLETLRALGEEAEIRDKLESQARSAKDLFADVALSSRQLLVGAVANPLSEGMDDLPNRFRGILNQMAAELAVSTLFKAIGGMFGAGSGVGKFFASLGGGLPGFATGGAFTVPGAGGTDSRLVQFKATPGERVTVETPEQRKRGGGGEQKGGGDTFVFPWAMPAEVRAVVENVAAQVAAGTAVRTVQRMGK